MITICNLITGLPVNVFAVKKEKYAQVFEGWHYIKILGNGVSDERALISCRCER
jgi:hypothetical protein